MFERKSDRWIDMLAEALFAYRITHGVTKETPFQIFYFRQPNFVYDYPGIYLFVITIIQSTSYKLTL
jgi:hypothetical protein